jgi:hypothetical protein
LKPNGIALPAPSEAAVIAFHYTAFPGGAAREAQLVGVVFRRQLGRPVHA